MKTVIVWIDESTPGNHYETGWYRLEVPADYVPGLITADDIENDERIVVLERP